MSTSSYPTLPSIEPSPLSGEEAAPPSSGFRSKIAAETYGLTVGDVISGKFRVERILGEGGMGLVVAATHLGLDERVALKLIHPNARKSAQAVGRFFQEAKAAAKLKSEHVARVLDVSQREDGSPYMVMEYLHGNDLRQVLNVDCRLPIETATEYVIQACEGLAEAHARGIVHRDIKPENLFLTERSQDWRLLKILDFGISKAALGGPLLSDPNIQTGTIMGSPCYMSPEQLRETASVDHRTDIWALGAVLYELLAGVTAFDGSRSLTGLIVQILHSDPPRLRTRRGDVPEALEEIVERCLRRNRDERFATAADLAVALLPFAPKRARVAAERAVAISKESGLASRELVMPPSNAPPLSLPGTPAFASTQLALNVELPPISARDIVMRSFFRGQPRQPPNAPPGTRRARVVASFAIFVLGFALAILAGKWRVSPANAGVARVTAQARALHERVVRAKVVADVVEPVIARTPIAPPRVAPPDVRHAAPVAPPPPSANPALEIRGAR